MAHSLYAAGLGVLSQALILTSLTSLAYAQAGPVAVTSPTHVHDAEPAPAGVLSLDQALHSAVDNNPDMAKASALIERARGLSLSARVLPNPEFAFEAENLAGSGAYKGADSAEFTYGISQKLELGGKRKARVNAARIGSLQAHAEAENIRHELIHSVRGAYMGVLAAEAEKDNATAQETLANTIYRQVSNLHKQGGETRAQMAKAKVMQQEAELDTAKANANISIARQALAMLMGRDTITETLDKNAFATLPTVTEPVVQNASEAPMLRKAALDLDEAEATLAQERSRKSIDPTIGVGIRQLRESRDNALVLNMAVPIPLFDRNTGGMVQAGAAVAQARAEQARAAKAYTTEVARLRLEMTNRQQIQTKLEKDVIPTMHAALEDLLKGYTNGRNSLLDVQDVNRSLRQASAQLIQARLDYHLLQAEFQHVTASHSATDIHPLEKDDHE